MTSRKGIFLPGATAGKVEATDVWQRVHPVHLSRGLFPRDPTSIIGGWRHHISFTREDHLWGCWLRHHELLRLLLVVNL